VEMVCWLLFNVNLSTVATLCWLLFNVNLSTVAIEWWLIVCCLTPTSASWRWNDDWLFVV
jgi:hypothetical protein